MHNVTITKGEAGTEQVVLVAQANHVTIRDVRVSGGFSEVRVQDAADITIERVIIPTGIIEVWNIVDLVLDRNQVGTGTIGGTVSGPTRVTANLVESTPQHLGSSIGISAHIYEGKVFPILVEDNRVFNAGHHGISVVGAKEVRVCDNMVVDTGSVGIYVSVLTDEIDKSAGGGEVCGNYVRGGGESALFIASGRDVAVHNNTLKQATWGLHFDPFGGHVRDNLIVGHVIGMAFLVERDAAMPTIRHNLLLENEVAATSWHEDGPFDFRENWWGTAHDPQAAGERSGLNRVEGDLAYAPWCLDSECVKMGGGPLEDAPAAPAAFVVACSTAALILFRTRRRRS